MARYAASPIIFKQSVAPDNTSDYGPTPGDIWVDQSLSPPVVKKCTSMYPFVWASIESGGAITLQTGGVNNASQTLLNLVAGSNVTLTNTSGGNVQISAAGAGAVVFADAETPSGTVNGVNTTFTLAAAPNPAGSLQLNQNGITLSAGGADYTLSSATITMTVAPATGDVLLAWYRH